MKKTLCLILGLNLMGCLGSQSAQSPGSAPTTPLKSLIATMGCSVSNTNGAFTIQCSDGSSSSSGSPSLHVKDGNGNNYPNLLWAGSMGSASAVLLNTISGTTLVYDGAGSVLSVTETYFDGFNCTGNSYAVPINVVTKNQKLANAQAWPGGTQAFSIVGFSHEPVYMQSEYTNNQCASLTDTYLSNVIKIIPSGFDSSDPLNIVLPLEIVSE